MSQPPYPPPGDEPPGQEGGTPPEENDVGRQPTEPFGQPDPYGQYGQPPYGQPPYDQPQYGQYTPPGQYGGQYVQPGQYGQYGQQPGPYGPPGQYSQYGQPPYGQPPYGQAPYGQYAGYSPVPPPAGPGRNRGGMIALIVGGVVVVAAIVVAVILGLNKDNNTPTASSTASAPTATPSASDSLPGESPLPTAAGGSVPPAKVPPTGLGTDQILNRFAQDCYSGNMDSCDLLYLAADKGSPYEKYGDTCAGRRPEGQDPLCSESFPS